MPHSKPHLSSGLQILSYLDTRMDLLPHDKKNLHNLEKGYEGERKFFLLLEKELTNDCIRIYDLLLEINQTEFQIDNLLIYQNTIFINEVKYYEGDFMIRGDKWYMLPSERGIRNPKLQLQRSEFLFRQILQQIGVHFNVEARLVFVHPDFTLYQAPYDQPIIFPTQLNRYIQKLNQIPSRLTSKHHKLAEQLIRSHNNTSRHERLPEYQFNDLEKGVVCTSCKGFMEAIRIVKLRCVIYGYEERSDSAVTRAVSEFHLLFPDKRIHTSIIYDWCKVINSKKIVRKILMENMELIRNGKYSYYVFKK